MINFIFQTIIQFVFKTNIEQLKKTYYNNGFNESRTQSFHDRVKFDKSMFHNKLVINICEGDVNPVVGYVIDWCDSIPIIKDIVSGQTLLCGGVMIPYNEQALIAVCSLSPRERYNLMAKREVWSDKQAKTDPRIPASVIVKMVKDAVETPVLVEA